MHTVLMAFVDYLCLEIYRGNSALLILLDTSVDFHTINHEALIKLLHNLVGIGETVLNWLNSF